MRALTRRSTLLRSGSALAITLMGGLWAAPIAAAHGTEPQAPANPAATTNEDTLQTPGATVDTSQGANPLTIVLIGGGALAAGGATLVLMRSKPNSSTPE